MVYEPETVAFPVYCQSHSIVVRMPKSFTVLEAVAFKQTCQENHTIYPDLKQAILDFSETTFIDSSGIGALVICHRQSQQHGTQLVLRNVPPQVMMALSMTELDKVFIIENAIQPEPLPTRRDPAAQIHSTQRQLVSAHPSVRSKAKRLLDIVGATVGLMITGLIFLPVAIAIKLEDGGPIFFGQMRCSWMGTRFRIWKFRSMVTNAEALKHTIQNQLDGPLFKNANDPRITRVGRFLRRTSLDELPQFWNVLKGEMSLVGTRPPTPDEIEQYEIPAWRRLDVKPGMTGEWQVSGRSNVKNFEDVVRLDLKYQEDWSLLYDIKLIIKTILVVFSRKSGAS